MTTNASPAEKAPRCSDGALLEGLVGSGSQACFEQLVQRHAGMVLGVCRRRLGQEADAEDAAQAVFLVLWHKAGRLTRKGSLAAWLHRVARNICSNLRRSQTIRQSHEREASMQRPVASTSANPSELREFLDAELDRLPEKYRTPLILYHLEGLSLQEVAEVMRVQPATLGTQLARGRNLLAGRLARRGVPVSAVTLAGLLAAEATSAAVPSGFAATVSQAVMSASTAAGGVSTPPMAAAEHVLRAMAAAKLKFALGVIVCLAGVIGGLVTWQAGVVSAPELGPIVANPPGGQRFDVSEYLGAIEVIDSESAAIVKLALSPDGRRLYAGRKLPGGAGELRVWDVNSGRLLHERFEPTGVTAVAVSPDGTSVAIGRGACDILICHAATCEQLRALPGHAVGPLSIAFSPDGRWLASGAGDWTLRLWEVATGERKAMQKGLRQVISLVRFDPTGRRVLAGSLRDGLQWWDWDETNLRELAEGKSAARSAEPSSRPAAGVAIEIQIAGPQQIIVRQGPGQSERRLIIAPESGTVSTAVASGDGRRFYVGTSSGQVFGWDAASEEPVVSWEAHALPLASIETNQSGAVVASLGTDGGIRVFRGHDGHRLSEVHAPHTLGRNNSESVRFAATANGGTLAVAVPSQRAEWEASVYDSRSGRRQRVAPIPGVRPAALALSGQGDSLILADVDGRLSWRPTDGTSEGRSLPVHDASVRVLTPLPGGGLVLSGDDVGTVCLSDTVSGRVLARVEQHTGAVTCAASSRDGRYVVTGGEGGKLQLLDVRSPHAGRLLVQHGRGIQTLAISPSGALLAAADTEGEVLLWELTLDAVTVECQLVRRIARDEWRPPVGQASPLQRDPVDREGAVLTALPTVTALAFSPGERTLVVGTSVDTLAHVRLDSEKSVRRSRCPGPVCGLAFCEEDASLCLALRDGQLYRQRISFPPLRTLKGSNEGVRAIEFAHAGTRLYSGGGDKTLRLWDTSTGEMLRSVDSGHGAIITAAISPDAKVLVTGGYGTGVYFWDAETLQRLGARFDHKARIAALVFSPDGRWLASGSWDGSVRVWDVKTRRPRAKYDLNDAIADVRFSPDGRWIAASTGRWQEWYVDGELRVWDATTGALRWRVESRSGGYGSVRYSPDGKSVLAVLQHSLEERDATTGDLLKKIVTHGGGSSMELLSSTTWIERSHPRSMRIWDAAHLVLRASYEIDAGQTFDLAVTPEGDQFAVSDDAGRIHLWKVPRE